MLTVPSRMATRVHLATPDARVTQGEQAQPILLIANRLDTNDTHH
jgi:hypothetical protein